ncbi:gamma-glutamyl-gamma-aminobutyrate hydrolase family protein [Flavihumibacter sp. UBA7668]|uniref:gamma-glutamyl-gamma-aminobutyrate hydrolase family protein n=1 Tax=Flavihumibacter sp. UBA7668 TaxID=1946542 RepID=UPI0025BF1F00|nr:gamma-glutamyl-gamma-aminobutyrate hydrolase family protein [Flavihumibacter sp. UBA7668]
MKKKLGISFTKTNFQNYWNWFNDEDLGEDLELVLLSFENPDPDLMKSCAGYVLTGGIDIDPIFYQGDLVYPNQPDLYQPERDRFESAIYRWGKESKKPILAICRGMQLVHVEEGGKLIQDLGDQNRRHKKDTEEDKQHGVIVQEGSRLFKWTGLIHGSVNSAHHQALDPDSVADQWQISAVDETGIIEAIEWKNRQDHPFLIAVQWHPERMINRGENPLSQYIKEHFLQSIRQVS